ncbi:MAG: ABC transporter ATP-binding protein [Brevinematia bacterium]
MDLSISFNELPHFPEGVSGREFLFSNVSFNVSEGEIFGVVGPSGCGKTILLKIIAGLIKQKEGQILKEGVDISYLSPDKRNVSMVFQDIALYPHLKNLENIEFPYVMHNKKENIDLEKIKEIAKLLHIEEEKILSRKPKFSSIGERQRVAIGKALSYKPDILLLDEPLSNIEDVLRNEIRHKLKSFIKEHKITTLYVSHNQRELGIFADEIAVLADKRIQQIGSYEELYNDPKTFFVSLYIGQLPSNFLTDSEVSDFTNGKISFYLTIRPDECSLEKQEDSIEITGRVNFIEPFIQEEKKLVCINYKARNFGVLLPLDFNIKLSDLISIYAPIKKAKFFTRKSEEELLMRIYNLW